MTMPRFRPPQQHRSQETLDRILDAAESVLETKSFSEATLVEIMERAGVTVGAFYRRFPDKDALLHLMDERFFAELYARGDAVLDPARWPLADAGPENGEIPRADTSGTSSTSTFGTSIARVIGEFTREAVGIYRARRGLLRSLFLRARSDPVIAASARQVNAHLIGRLRAVLMPRATEIRHPDPAYAIELGYMVLVGALRETTLFDDVWPERDASREVDLAAELTRVYVNYLGIRDPGPATA